MALIPVTDKFHVVDANVPTTNKGSATANAGRQAYTMQDVIDTVGSAGSSQPVFSGLSAQGTDNTTTSIMSYGINVFTTVDSGSNYATKLPQPVTGQSVTVINNSSVGLYVYPSNVGGQVNNLPIDTPYLVPPNGVGVTFYCTANPAPGVWNTVTAATPPPPIVYEWSMDTTTATGSAGVAFGYYGIPGPNQSSNNPPGGIFGNSTGSFGGDTVPTISMSNTAAPAGPINWGSTLPGSYNTLAPDLGTVSKVKIDTNFRRSVDVIGAPTSPPLTSFIFALKRYWQNNATGIPAWQIQNGVQMYQENSPDLTTPGWNEVTSSATVVAPAYNGNIGDEGTLYNHDLAPFLGASAAFQPDLNSLGQYVSTSVTDFYYALELALADGTSLAEKIYKFRVTIEFSA